VHVRSLTLFGSVTRGEQGAEGDVDLLVSFSEPPSLAVYMDLKSDLEDCPILVWIS
jgi:predicted nucleotidyltransferase